MQPTPFGTDAEEHDLNAVNVARLLASESAGPLRFVALGDSHQAYDELERTIDQINSRTDIDLVVHVGDISNLGLLQEFEWTERVLARLNVPVLVALGNHDCISSGKEVYRAMFGDYDFSFVYKSRKFVFFNSNFLEFSGDVPNRTWIDAQLSELEGADSAILVTHQDPRAVPPTDFYETMIRTHPVSLFVHGHFIDFELDTWFGVPVLQCSTLLKTGLFTIVTVSGSEVSFELCRGDVCVPHVPSSASD